MRGADYQYGDIVPFLSVKRTELACRLRLMKVKKA